jgi:hypothetical protein
MPSARALLWIDRLLWTLIYGGLFTAVLGLAVRHGDPVLGWSLIVLGGLVAACGIVLVWVRSRMPQAD